MTDKQKKLAWAYSIMQEMVEGDCYGNIMFNMQDGVVISAKKEVTVKPILDPIG